MRNYQRVAVASRSFSTNVRLREELEARFPNSWFNDKGVSLRGKDLAEFLADAEYAILGLEPVDGDLLSVLPSLSAVAKFGVGTDSIDFKAAERHCVEILVSRGTNSNAVAELVVLLALACLRRLSEAQAVVADGNWRQPLGRELRGSVVGIVGYGHVGQHVADVVQSLGCPVLVCDPGIEASAAGSGFISLVELVTKADIVTVHVPLLPETYGLISDEEIACMKSDGILINTSRGGVVDEAAVVNALRAGKLGAAGLDVLRDEPSVDVALHDVPGLIVTPHIGGSTEQAIFAMGRAAIENLAAYAERIP